MGFGIGIWLHTIVAASSTVYVLVRLLLLCLRQGLKSSGQVTQKEILKYNGESQGPQTHVRKIGKRKDRNLPPHLTLQLKWFCWPALELNMLLDQASGELEEETRAWRNHRPCAGLGVRELREETQRTRDAEVQLLYHSKKVNYQRWCPALYTNLLSAYMHTHIPNLMPKASRAQGLLWPTLTYNCARKTFGKCSTSLVKSTQNKSTKSGAPGWHIG